MRIMGRLLGKGGLAMLASATFLVAQPLPVSAETYQVTLRRIDRNVYHDMGSKVPIVTQMCLESAVGQQAVLVYDPYSPFKPSDFLLRFRLPSQPSFRRQRIADARQG
jgi:hypothetical protein